MIRYLIFLFTFTAFFLFSSRAHACKCDSPSLKLLYQSADAVFVGTGEDAVTPNPKDQLPAALGFNVTEAFKGPKLSVSVISVERANDVPSMCRARIDSSRGKFLIFVKRIKKDKLQFLSDCYGASILVENDVVLVAPSYKVPMSRLKDHLVSRADGVGRLCERDLDCGDVACSALDSGLKARHSPKCVKETIPGKTYNFCKCMCPGCH